MISDQIRIPLEEIRFTFVRSSGPGGQNVNKVASKAVLRWNPAVSGLLTAEQLEKLAIIYPSYLTKEQDIVITSQKTRDALKNKEDCLEKLRAMILVILKKPKPRIPTRPTKGSVRRRLNDKALHSLKKQRRKNVTGDS